VSQRLKADAALALCSLVWGATFVVVKGALEDASVFAFLAVRFSLAALLMAMIYRRAVRQLTHAEIRAGAQIGFFMFTGYAFQTLGLIRTTPSKGGFITGFGVVLVPVLMALFWGRRVNRWVWGGALAALVGLYYLTVPAGGFAHLNVGDLFVFVCAVLFALHIIYVGRYSRQHSVGALSFLQVATTAVLTLVALPVASVTGWEPLRLHWTTELLFAVLITAGLATALAFSVQVWAQQYTTSTHTAILFSLEPVFAALTSYVMLGERLGGRGLVGAGLILVGILVAELKGPTQAAVDSPGPVAESVESGSSAKPRFL
jgi:drug/metabolite transporter (DMT)-like permease